MHHELNPKVLQTYDTGYTDEYGLKELVETAQDSLGDMEVIKEKKLVQQLLNIIRSGSYLRRHEVVYAIRAMDEKNPVDLDPIYMDKIR